ncbi:hypothetical protein [Dankookia sp. P2]|uniref:hypothetical protein n=1 Tax=Dankookia sp. P2 TaxID=3423955 RepID=UPI003D6755C9
MIRNIAMGLVAATLVAAPALAQRDGTPGNPPSTATQRTLDRATGSAPTPADGTRGNPPGTAVAALWTAPPGPTPPAPTLATAPASPAPR